MNELRILLIGATGVFGRRLAEQLMNERGIALALAARSELKLATLARSLSKPVATRTLDRNLIKATDLAGYDLVIDAAGPFQASGSQVIDAAIKAKCHYFDLADGREFVGQTGKYDESAREADIAVVTGVSSIPALSHAVIENLTTGWQQIEEIGIGIFPGNRAPRGKAVVEAILSYVGKPVRVFRDGNWQCLPGWGMTHRKKVKDVGNRWASICDTPEQDLLVERFSPARSAEFFAGMELSILHLGLLALSMPVRWGWIKSLRPAAGPLLWMARQLVAFGSDRGGMTVEVAGQDADGQAICRCWTLQANANRGPYVPILATLALIRKLRRGQLRLRGAQPCTGMLVLGDFRDDFGRMGITEDIETSSW